MQNRTLPCPHCGQQLSWPDDLAGRSIQCPECKLDFVVPRRSDAEPTGAASQFVSLPLRQPLAARFWFVLLAPALAVFLMYALGIANHLNFDSFFLVNPALSGAAALYCGFTTASRRVSKGLPRILLGLVLSVVFFVFCFTSCMVGCTTGGLLRELSTL